MSKAPLPLIYNYKNKFPFNRLSSFINNHEEEILNQEYLNDLFDEMVLDNSIKYLAIDTETTGLDFLKDDVLLVSISDGERSFLFTWEEFYAKMVCESSIKKAFFKKTLVAHNLKFDLNFILYKLAQEKLVCEHLLREVYCTLIAEQKMLEGWEPRKGLFLLPEVLKRRGFPAGDEMDKSIRDDFIDNAIALERKHLEYALDDTKYLIPLMHKQKEVLKKLKLDFHVLHHQMPLIKILSQVEREGVAINGYAWRKRARKYKRKVELYEHFLNTRAKQLDPNFFKFNKDYTNEKERRYKKKKNSQ